MFTFSVDSQIKSNFVRLGEHDTWDRSDHIDVDIARIENHAQYDHALKVNDVSVVHLVKDVEFTGKFGLNRPFFREQFQIFNIFVFVHAQIIFDQYVCQSLTPRKV